MTSSQPTFSFTLGDVPSAQILAESRRAETHGRTEWIHDRLGIRTVLDHRSLGSDAIEWVLSVQNQGSSPTAALRDVSMFDRTDPVPEKYASLHEAKLARSRGSRMAMDDFEYSEERVFPGETILMNAGLGRSSQNWLPFFRIDLLGRGYFYAIGWTGEWSSTVHQTPDHDLHVTASLPGLDAWIAPGETLVLPKMLQLDYEGDPLDGHNALRALLLENYTPHLDGRPVDGPFTIAHWGAISTDEQLRRLKHNVDHGVRQEYFWIDAGWYGTDSSYSPDELEGDWPEYVGDWVVNPDRHPNGLKPLSDAAHDHGMGMMLWIEPGRAIEGTSFLRDHPTWYLGTGHERLLDFGNPDAWSGMLEFISDMITELSLDIYREDFNIDPLPFWEAKDEPGRAGISELQYVHAFYAFWDELRRRFPRLIIDNCSSGGRRIDLEMITRSVAVFRSDWYCVTDGDPVGAQNHQVGISLWVPMHGAATWASMATAATCSTFRVRSCFAPALQMSTFPRLNQPIQDDYPWEWFNRMSDEYLRARPYMTGDFYPLTEYRVLATGAWTVYQMHRSDLDEGCIVALRNVGATYAEATFSLRGLDATHTYAVEDVDAGTTATSSGVSLQQGFHIELSEDESSSLFFYRAS